MSPKSSTPAIAGRIGGIGDEIVRVEVIVDDLAAASRHAKRKVARGALEGDGGERPDPQIGDVREQADQPWRLLQVPEQRVGRGGMGETEEREADPCETGADRRRLGGRGRGRRQRLARQEGQEPQDMGSPVGERDERVVAARTRRADTGHRESRIAERNVPQGGRLHGRDARVFRRIGDLEHPTETVLRHDAEVQVALPRQRHGATLDAEPVAREHLGLGAGQAGLRHREQRIDRGVGGILHPIVLPDRRRPAKRVDAPPLFLRAGEPFNQDGAQIS